MPPFGADEKVQAIHVLNVLDCAKALVSALSQTGGVEKLQLPPGGVREALLALFEHTSKLQVYEVRAKARGTVATLDDEALTMAIKDLRDKRTLSVDEEDVRDATPEQIEAAFSIDGDGLPPEEPVAPIVAPVPAPEERAPDSGTIETTDAFSL